MPLTTKDNDKYEPEPEVDESLYEDDLDHEGHWFEIWGED